MAHDPYSYFQEEDGDEVVYYFTSKDQIMYSVYFRANEYDEHIADFPTLLENSYAFGFYHLPPNGGGKFNVDVRIRVTIDTIIQDFVAEKGDNIIILYHCDHSDGRQHKRSCSFERWYQTSTTKDTIYKTEINFVAHIDEHEEVNYYIGYLTPLNNPEAAKAHEEFKVFARGLTIEK